MVSYSFRFQFTGLLLLYLFGTGQAIAMWTKAGDAELVNTSSLIVEASYLGQTTFIVGTASVSKKSDNQNSKSHQSPKLSLGVLQVTKVHKGNSELKQVLIRVPNPSLLRKSDDIIYSAGQRGLWFLREDIVNPGLYVADHPQRFVPEAKQAEKLSAIQEILDK